MAIQSSFPPLMSRFEPEVLVLLRGLELKARYVVEGYLSGLHQSPFHGASTEFSEYREYHPGDDLRHLDWRVFLRHMRHQRLDGLSRSESLGLEARVLLHLGGGVELAHVATKRLRRPALHARR